MKRINQNRRFGSTIPYMFHSIEADLDGGDGDGGTGDLGGDGGDAGGGASGGDGGASGGDAGAAPIDYFSTAPEDWRAQALTKAGFQEGEDFDKAMKQLERVSDFGVFTKNYLSAQEKIRKGEISNGLPENPTEEQLADYREAHGIPQAVEDYQLTLEDGLELNEADEPTMQKVYQIALENNIPASAVSQMFNEVIKDNKAADEARISQDGIDQQMNEKQLKEAWGGDFTVNVNSVKGLVNQLPETVKDAFMDARLPDGKAIFNSPEVMVAMAEWARKINPMATVVPNSSNPMQTMSDEIKALEEKMGTPEWYRDTEAQKRYQDLITAKEQMAS